MGWGSIRDFDDVSMNSCIIGEYNDTNYRVINITTSMDGRGITDIDGNITSGSDGVTVRSPSSAINLYSTFSSIHALLWNSGGLI